MKYPPKQTRSTCHCRVFKSKVYESKDKHQWCVLKDQLGRGNSSQLQWWAVTWGQDFQHKATEPVPLHLYTTLLHARRELHAQHTKQQSIKEIPLCFKCKDAAFHCIFTVLYPTLLSRKKPPLAAPKRGSSFHSILWEWFLKICCWCFSSYHPETDCWKILTLCCWYQSALSGKW